MIMVSPYSPAQDISNMIAIFTIHLLTLIQDDAWVYHFTSLQAPEAWKIKVIWPAYYIETIIFGAIGSPLDYR